MPKPVRYVVKDLSGKTTYRVTGPGLVTIYKSIVRRFKQIDAWGKDTLKQRDDIKVELQHLIAAHAELKEEFNAKIEKLEADLQQADWCLGRMEKWRDVIWLDDTWEVPL
jgi:hypothetical protein